MDDQSSAEPTPISDDAAEHLGDAYDDMGSQKPEAQPAAMMTDALLLRAYQRTDRKRSNPEAEEMLAEIEQRGLNV